MYLFFQTQRSTPKKQDAALGRIFYTHGDVKVKIPHNVPCPNGTDRAQKAKELRELAAEISRTRPHAASRNNAEELDYAGSKFPTNFTKGLHHDEFGILSFGDDYRTFVEAINSNDTTLFENHVKDATDRAAELGDPAYQCTFNGDAPQWRGWESPRAGHVYELQGPDADSVGMAPAPRVGSSEKAAELAEVYGLAILRDVPFTSICAGDSAKQLCEGDSDAQLTSTQVVDALNSMPFFAGESLGGTVTSSTPAYVDNSGLNNFERNRRLARTQDDGSAFTAPLTTETVFRGSTKGALTGPYLSQFMLIGSVGLAGPGGGASSFPGKSAGYDLQDGFIRYGSLSIDQRTATHKSCLDHMTNWPAWLDVQNGANFKGADLFEEKRRFITTPRDLATYVHFDALYEAYLNAVLIIDSMGTPASKGFPEPGFRDGSGSARRTAFATFGGPHILSLVTEVATRCLKAVRREKFNYHRRARPEAMGGRMALVECGSGIKLGEAQAPIEKMHDELPDALKAAIIAHNEAQNETAMNDMRLTDCAGGAAPFSNFDDCNLLLPMAFPEGSPMHPAYGAGHATVAGGCITMVKAFFEMFESNDSGVERPLVEPDGTPIAYVPNANGGRLVADSKFSGTLTIQGELDKLAANISIGRNMAGVHFYSDYYDSLRMGERVAVGILLEQAPTYGDSMETTFTSFDGDFISISGQADAAPQLTIIDRDGKQISNQEWWLRHVPGEQMILGM